MISQVCDLLMGPRTKIERTAKFVIQERALKFMKGIEESIRTKSRIFHNRSSFLEAYWAGRGALVFTTPFLSKGLMPQWVHISSFTCRSPCFAGRGLSWIVNIAGSCKAFLRAWRPNPLSWNMRGWRQGLLQRGPLQKWFPISINCEAAWQAECSDDKNDSDAEDECEQALKLRYKCTKA